MRENETSDVYTLLVISALQPTNEDKRSREERSGRRETVIMVGGLAVTVSIIRRSGLKKRKRTDFLIIMICRPGTILRYNVSWLITEAVAWTSVSHPQPL